MTYHCTQLMWLMCLFVSAFPMDPWSCYVYTEQDTYDLHDAHIPDEDVCEKNGRVFTAGYNTDYLGCETCWCCKPNEVNIGSMSTDLSTSSQLQFSSTRKSTTNETDCACQCLDNNAELHKWTWVLSSNLSREELKLVVEDDFNKRIKDQISVSKETLSTRIRSKTSALDDRSSSVYLGRFSIAILLVPIVFVVTVDCVNMYNRSNA